MKSTISTVFTLLVAAATSVQAANIELCDSVVNSAARKPFLDSKTFIYEGSDLKREAPIVYEPEPNRNYTLQDDLVFVVQCTTPGFRPECVTFGSPPGKCVSYFSFDRANSTELSDTFNNNVTSISTNTGGLCQFYKYVGCDNKGDDRGVSLSYQLQAGGVRSDREGQQDLASLRS
ncbi:hypothetical protein F66182_2472 [Fusarium sp. NRRL 66182]|nr:hypothetical protein F66182_2472 [Fusarium sp. NRRL 66182]